MAIKQLCKKNLPILAFLFLLIPSSAFSGQTILNIAAASNLTYVMPELVDAFERQHRRVKVRLSLASTGSLYMQIKNGAPYDLFLAADEKRPRLLFEEGYTTEVPFVYASGRLVLWSGPKKDLSEGIRALTAPHFKKIALANPRHAPYGEAARQAIEKAGLWKELKAKFIFGENIGQTAQFVQSGSAQAGFIAESMLQHDAMKEGSVYPLPHDAYAPIIQRGVLIRGENKNSKDATLFRDFLFSVKGRAILTNYGYGVP